MVCSKKAVSSASVKRFAKLRHLAGIQVQVGQLDGDLLQGVIVGIDEAVDPGLRPMQRVGFTVPVRPARS